MGVMNVDDEIYPRVDIANASDVSADHMPLPAAYPGVASRSRNLNMNIDFDWLVEMTVTT